MIIDKIDINLTDNTFAYIYRANTEEILETFKQELKKYIKIIEKFIDVDLTKLSDENFYDLLCNVYSITLVVGDYLEIISKKYNKKYDRFAEIGTTMTFSDTATEGKGINFSWWEQLYQIRYIVAVAENFNLEYNTNFSIKQLKKMIADKNIVLVTEKSIPLNGKINFQKENVQTFPTMNIKISKDIFWKVDGTIYKDENFPIIVKKLRKKFTKKRILKDINDYIQELQEQMNEVMLYNYHDYFYDEASKMCKEWYEKSPEKQAYERILKKVNDGNKND